MPIVKVVDVEDLRTVQELLGGARAIGGELRSPLDLVARVREGLLPATVEHLAGNLDMKADELGSLAGVPIRTWHRRKTAGERLKPSESEGVLRIARIAGRAADVLGDLGAAHQWLRTPIVALGGATPLSLLDTEPGAELVSDVLGRLEYGVFS